MKKYIVPSFLLLLSATLFFGLLVPTLLSFGGPSIQPWKNQEGGSFVSQQEPYILVSDAVSQASHVAKSRALPLETILLLIQQHTHEWPLEIFPAYVDIRTLNQEIQKTTVCTPV